MKWCAWQGHWCGVSCVAVTGSGTVKLDSECTFEKGAGPGCAHSDMVCFTAFSTWSVRRAKGLMRQVSCEDGAETAQHTDPAWIDDTVPGSFTRGKTKTLASHGALPDAKLFSVVLGLSSQPRRSLGLRSESRRCGCDVSSCSRESPYTRPSLPLAVRGFALESGRSQLSSAVAGGLQLRLQQLPPPA